MLLSFGKRSATIDITVYNPISINVHLYAQGDPVSTNKYEGLINV